MILGSTISGLRSVGTSDVRGALREAADARLAAKAGKSDGEAKTERGTVTKELTPEQEQQVSELRQIDRHVRAHEQAHIAAGQGLVTGGPNYSFTYGPDGKQYAVAGEVGIDTSAESKPEANIAKGEQIQAAALAPADPSPQDYRVAAVGAQLVARGQSELSQQRNAEQTTQVAAQEGAQRERNQQSSTERGSAIAAQARQVGEAQNIEPKSPVADQNDVARQRIANAYQPVAAAATSLSVFA